MKALILAAGYATRLHPLTLDRPKSLVKVGDKTILDHLMDLIEATDYFNEVLIVTNHRFAGVFYDWLKQRGEKLPTVILDDGTKTNEGRLGAIGDMNWVIQEEDIDDDVYVMASDNLAKFDIMDLVRFFHEKRESCIFGCWEESVERRQRAGSPIIEEDTRRITRFIEKPKVPISNWCVPPFYIYPRHVLPLIDQYLAGGHNPDAPGYLVEFLHERVPVFLCTQQVGCYDIGTLESYLEVCKEFGVKPEQF